MKKLRTVLFNVFCVPFLLVSFALFAFLNFLDEKWHGIEHDDE